jgi:D-alanyl-D-alanine carboxypeptidase (penicillin-binding protein 5/6)
MDAGTILGEIPVKHGSERKVQVISKEDAFATLPIEASSSMVNTKIKLDDKVQAPVSKGQKVGEVEIYEGDQLLGKVDAITAAGIPEGGIMSIIGISNEAAKAIERILASVLILVVLLFAAYIVLKRRQIRRRKLRRQERVQRYQQEANRRNFDEHWR